MHNGEGQVKQKSSYGKAINVRKGKYHHTAKGQFIKTESYVKYNN
jgi:hypothetical protein